jgi:hypothetical protein
MENTWISQERKYLFVSSGKCACSKIQYTLMQLEGFAVEPTQTYRRDLPGFPLKRLSDFTAEEQDTILTDDSWYRFCFLRNPYRRLLSAYLDKMDPAKGTYRQVQAYLLGQAGAPLRDGFPSGWPTFSEFLDYVLALPDEARDYHWRSLLNLLQPERMNYQFVGRVSTFHDDFTVVLQRLAAPPELVATVPDVVGATLPVPLALAYLPSMARGVAEAYEKDFAWGGYDPDSWRF